MLEARGLSKRYNRIPAVDNVNFRIEPRRILGYLGPNGSGKSTTVKMLTGLLEPSDGMILLDGEDIQKDLAGYKRRIGYVPEEPHLYPHLSGKEYLQLVGRLRGMRAKQLDEKIDIFLRLFGLFEDRYVALQSYSKGMRQKILLCAALLHNPDVLIFDEPFSGLDVTAALIFRNLLKALANEGKMILYSSHVLEVVEKVCDEVLILRKGIVVAHDSVEHLRDLMSSPSLEDIFAQLTQQTDTAGIAAGMIAAMRL